MIGRKIILIIGGGLILYVISIPLIEGTHEQKIIKVYPERRQDTLTKNNLDE